MNNKCEPTHGIKNGAGYWVTQTGGLSIVCGCQGEMMALVENEQKACFANGNECDLEVWPLPQPLADPAQVERAKQQADALLKSMGYKTDG